MGNVTNHIHIEELEDCDNQELTNTINEAFLEPLEEYRLEQPLTKFPTTASLRFDDGNVNNNATNQ